MCIANAFAEIADAEEAKSRSYAEAVRLTRLSDKQLSDMEFAVAGWQPNPTDATVVIAPPISDAPPKSCRTPDGGLWLSPECAKALLSGLQDDYGSFVPTIKAVLKADGVELGDVT